MVAVFFWHRPRDQSLIQSSILWSKLPQFFRVRGSVFRIHATLFFPQRSPDPRGHSVGQKEELRAICGALDHILPTAVPEGGGVGSLWMAHSLVFVSSFPNDCF